MKQLITASGWIRMLSISGLIWMGLVVSGCGQKGPLRLPPAPPEPNQAPTTSTAQVNPPVELDTFPSEQLAKRD